jgi:hypothetical protein
MSQAGDIVVPERRNKDLRFVLEAAESLAMDDAVAVALIFCAYGAGIFRSFSAAGFAALRRIL